MNEKFKMIVFVVILGLISAGILSGMSYLTEERIIKNEELKEKSVILEAFNIKYNSENVENIFDDNITISKKDELTFYTTKNGEVAFKFDGPGLWGPIRGYIALQSDLETITGINILEQEETPGLGGIIGEKPYLDTFKGKKVEPKLVILKNSGGNNAENEVDGVTGATLTSKAFESLLNKDIIKHKEIWVK